jgi:hypothetical protein
LLPFHRAGALAAGEQRGIASEMAEEVEWVSVGFVGLELGHEKSSTAIRLIQSGAGLRLFWVTNTHLRLP